jgi:hypothetical protein
MSHNRTSPGKNTGAVSKNRWRECTVSSDRAKTASTDFVFLEVCEFLSGRTFWAQRTGRHFEFDNMPWGRAEC